MDNKVNKAFSTNAILWSNSSPRSNSKIKVKPVKKF